MGRKHWRSLVVVSACAVVLGLNSRLATAQVTVNTATPNNATQGTSALNVTVSGSGFEQGAAATWFVTGTTNKGGVTVNSTAFVNSSTLIANITVANTATTGGYDVSVTNSNGRTGVGSDAFTINPMAVTSTLYSTDANGAAVTVQGDGASASSSYNNTPSDCALFDPHHICIIESLLPNDWYLRLSSTIGRSVGVTFHALNGSPDESALDGYYLGSAVTTRCFDSNNNRLDIQFLLPGSSFYRCSLRVNFSANGIGYAYAMGPAFPGTGWSTVTCTSGASSQSCNTWTITPTPGSLLPNPVLANVATLQEFTKHSSSTIGTYLMTFNIVLTQP